MGDPADGQPITPERRKALAAKLEELELLGVPTDALKKVLEERPQDFEREAEAAMRRELLGEGAEAPVSDEPIRISGAAEPEPPKAGGEGAPPAAEVKVEAASEPAPKSDAARTAPPMAEAEVPAPLAPELPPNEGPVGSLEELEAKLAAYVAQAEAQPEPAPTPAVLEEREPPSAVESDMSAELAQALEASAAAPPPSEGEPGGPLLAGGDALSFEAPPAPSEGPKPAPPSGRAAAAGAAAPALAKPAPPGAAPGRRVVVKAAPSAAAAAAGAPQADTASTVLPATEAPKRGALKAVGAVAVVALVLVGTYMAVVNAPPTAAFSFSPSAPTAGEPVLFTSNGTTDPNGDPVSFKWQFGDGTPEATTATASHTFPKSGAYLVNLTATDDHKNSVTIQKTVNVAAGSITAPPYRYGDRQDYTVVGHSHVEGVLAPMAKVEFDFGTIHGSCDVTAVDLSYDGPQSRSILADPAEAKDGFLDPHSTYVGERSLQGLRLLGQINISGCPATNVAYSGSATLVERTFSDPQNNDTVRGETAEDVAVTVNSDPPKDFDSSARLTDFPALKDAATQLHLESVYAGHRFSTEATDNGEITAEGVRWSWITQGTSVVAGQLAVKVHFEALNLPITKVSRLFIDLWISSTSAFPVREYYFVSGIEGGNRYQSLFDATASAPGVAGTAPIPFGNGTRSYRTVSGTDLAPLGVVPRAVNSSDFAFTPRTAYDEGLANCPDLVSFMASNPNAYTINATYSRSTGNPKWMLDLSQTPNGAAERVEDEHSTSTQVRCGGGEGSANRTRSEIGSVVSLNYAADLLSLEPTADALFPGGVFDGSHANFTVRQNLTLPTVSLNAALTASRAAVPYAFGAESLSTETVRIRAFVDAQSGQLVFALTETGTALP